jgi:hypothetical protein
MLDKFGDMVCIRLAASSAGAPAWGFGSTIARDGG